MKRPDLDTLACVNAECQLFRRAGARTLVIRKVYGQDRIRLLRYRGCGEEFSERRGSALFNTKLTEAKAERSSTIGMKAVASERQPVSCMLPQRPWRACAAALVSM